MAKIKLAIWLILLLSLLSYSTSATANSSTVKWLCVNIPTEGESGNWVLASGSDVQYLRRAIDGTLYCYAKPSGTSYTLFRSTDGGYSWSYTGKVKDAIVDIATAPDNASLVYYATSSSLYESTDSGISFTRLLPNPGGAGSGNLTITSIDVARLGDNSIVAVGTRDTDGSQYGGVYTLDESDVLPSWIDTNVGSYDVYAVAFSPNFPADRQLMAVATNETDTFVTAKVGSGGWGETIGDAKLDKDNSGTPTPVAVDASAAIAFPDDYDATTEDCALFAAIDAGSDSGDVYKINGVGAPDSSVATDLNIGSLYGLSNVDVTSLDVIGGTTTANILAGAASSAQVYVSSDGGINWTRGSGVPTGQSKTHVLVAPDFTSSGGAYATTSGTESAFSITQDGGVTWNQVGLIDTAIGSGNVLDLAISPSYSQDNTLFMLTFGGKYSLWRSLNDGTGWERVFTNTLASVDSINLVELSPRYGNESRVVYVAGTSIGEPAIWRSTDNGQAFRCRVAPFSIDTWVVVDDNTLFICCQDTANNLGLVYHTTDSGLTYSSGALAGSYQLSSIALSPDYDQDETILVGNINGQVYWSSDNGATFELLGQQLPELITAGSDSNSVTVTFDPDYSRNNTVYAASHCHKTLGAKDSSAIYRFIIGTSTEWESIDSTLSDGDIVEQLIASAEGVLYAANLKADGGIERCLDPTYPLGPTFETVTRGLGDGATLSELWQCGNRLWSIDSHNTKLMTYTDSLTQPVTPTSPSDEASGVGTIINYTINDITLDWEALSGATEYKWQLNYGTNFSTVPPGFDDDTKSTSTRLPSLEPATTYYWRVKATEPVLSPWSATWSFTTSLGAETVALELYSPEAGAVGVPLKPIFQWSSIAGANKYELLVATDVSFTSPLIIKIGDYALLGTAWQCDVTLNYNTTYFWKVRAGSSDTWSAWGAVGAFTTELPPPSPSPNPAPSLSTLSNQSPNPVPSPSPPYPPVPPQPTIPDWVKCLIGGLLLTIVLLLITMLVLVTGIRRL